MEFKKTSIDGVIVVVPDVFEDSRGFFLESYHAQKYAEGGIQAVFVQDNHSKSVKGTLRGLHAQYRRPQAKLVRVVQGEIFDVVVDARFGSPTYGRWIGESLSSRNRHQLFIPTGFLHGFCVLSDTAEVEYKCSDFYDASGDLQVLWNDPEIGIEWPVADPLLSEKDRGGKPLAEYADLIKGWHLG